MDTHILIPYQPYGDEDTTWNLTASRESLFISVFPKTMVSTLLSENNFTGRLSFMGARGAHKRHHECYYLYHRVLNSEIVIRQ